MPSEVVGHCSVQTEFAFCVEVMQIPERLKPVPCSVG